MLAILFLFPFTAYSETSGQTPEAAFFAEGNVFFYDLSLTWNSTDSNSSIPDEYLKENQEWLRINITKITASTIYFESTLHYKNGTEINYENSYIDTETYACHGVWSGYFSKPNLSANETATKFNMLGTNETFLRTYSNGERETNYIEQVKPNVNGSKSLQYLKVNVDKQTGMLVEYRHEVPVQAEYRDDGTFDVDWVTVSIRLREPSCWSTKTSEVPFFVVVPLAIISTIAFVSIMVRKTAHNKPSNNVP